MWKYYKVFGKKEVNENCILGYSVKDEVTKLSDISYEMDNVTVEGYVFGIMPSTKKGFNSFTLKFSDLTTSMYVRIYAKTEEEYNELIAKFKENMWIRVNGYVKNNPFYNDFVLNARNIEKIDSKLEEIKDLEEEMQKDLDVILIDRSLFDRIIWVNRLYLKNGMKEDEYKDYLNTYIPLVNEKIDIVIALKTDAITALKRDYNANLSLEKRNFLNEDNVNEYNISLDNTIKLFENKAYVFDTTDTSQRETSIEVAHKILDSYRSRALDQVKKMVNFK